MSEVEAQDDERPEEEQDAHEDAVIEKHLSQLIEHFSTVEIVVTRYNPQGNTTTLRCQGRGDYYARTGALRACVLRRDAEIHHEARPQ